MKFQDYTTCSYYNIKLVINTHRINFTVVYLLWMTYNMNTLKDQCTLILTQNYETKGLIKRKLEILDSQPTKAHKQLIYKS